MKKPGQLFNCCLVLNIRRGCSHSCSRTMTLTLLLSLPYEILGVIIGHVINLSQGRLTHLSRLLLTCKCMYYHCLPQMYGAKPFEVSGPMTYLLSFAVHPRLTLTRTEVFHYINALSVRAEQNWFDQWCTPKPPKILGLFHLFDTLKSLSLYVKADQTHNYVNRRTPSSIQVLTLHITPSRILPVQCLATIKAIAETRFHLKSLVIILRQSSLAPELPILRPRFDPDYTESATKMTKCRVVYGMGPRYFNGLAQAFQTAFPSLKKTKITTNICIGKMALAIAHKSASTLSFLRVDNFDAAYIFMDYRDMFSQIPKNLSSAFDTKLPHFISLPILKCIVLDLSSFIVSKRWCVMFDKLNFEPKRNFSTVCALHDRRCSSLFILCLEGFPLRPDAQWNYFNVPRDFSAKLFSTECYLLPKSGGILT